MATSKGVTLALAAAALGGAVAVGFLLLRPQGKEADPDRVEAPPPPPPERIRDPDAVERPPTGGGAPEAGEGDDERDIHGPEGGATAEEILAAFERAATDVNAWKEIERLLSIAGTDDPRVTAKILEFLDHERFRVWAAELAKHLKDPAALEKFLALAQDPKASPWTRAVALIAGANVGGPELVPVAKEILRTAEPGKNLFAAAARALGQAGTVESTQVLLDLLREGGGSPGSAVLEAIGRSRDPEAVGDLLRIARETEDSEVRGRAYAALGMIGDAAAVQELLNAVQGGDNQAKLEAARALASIQGKAGAAAIEKALSTPVDPAVLPYLVQALGRIGSKSSVEPVGNLLKDSTLPEGTRAQAARTLGEIGDPSIRPYLFEAYRNAPAEANSLRSAIVTALASSCTREDVPRLEQLRDAAPKSSSEHYMLDLLIKRLLNPAK